MKVYRAAKVQLHSFTTSATDGWKVISLTPRPLPPRERAPGTNWIGGWVGPRVDVDVLEKSLTTPPQSKPGSPSPLSNHYIDYATSSPRRNVLFSTVLSNVNQQTIPSSRMLHHVVCQKFTDVLGESSLCLTNLFLSKYFWIGARGQKDYFVLNEEPTKYLPSPRCISQAHDASPKSTMHLPISNYGSNLSHTFL
jgi:hypothetical protein